MKDHIFELRRKIWRHDWPSPSHIHNLSSCEIKAWKKTPKSSSLNGSRTHDLCDTGAVLYQLSYQTNWELVTLWVRNIPADGEEERSYTWSGEWKIERFVLALLTKTCCFSTWFVCMNSSDTFHILTGFPKTGLSLSRISINLHFKFTRYHQPFLYFSVPL